MREWARRRVRRYFDASPLALASGLTLLCVPAIFALAWISTGRWEDERIETAIQRQTIQIARQLTDEETDIEVAFGQLRGITTWVAEEGHSLTAILKPDDVSDENIFLQGIASSFGLDLIYIMDANGISVAASNWDSPASTVGSNYSDREHFQTAITGIPGRQFGVGRTTKVPGFFFSMPVRNGNQVVGTVGVKLDQPRLMHLVRVAGSIISDDYGAVVLTDNPKYMFNAVPNSTLHELSAEKLMKRYVRQEFPPLPVKAAGLAKHPDIMLLDDRPVLIGSRTLIDAGLTIHALSDFDGLHEIQRQRYVVFVSSAVASVLLLWGLWIAVLYFLRARHYRRRLEVVNIQLSKLNDELQEQATHDFLTGALNQRAFSTILGTELERVKRYGGELCLGIIDIDHFKRVNDTRGHAVGDVALEFLVDAISERMRRTDVLARLGGEEFVLLMPNTPLNEGMQVIDRMRQAISAIPAPGLEPPLLMTFSAGVASWRPGVTDRALLNSADKALYAAKGSGRNRVMKDEEA